MAITSTNRTADGIGVWTKDSGLLGATFAYASSAKVGASVVDAVDGLVFQGNQGLNRVSDMDPPPEFLYDFASYDEDKSAGASAFEFDVARDIEIQVEQGVLALLSRGRLPRDPTVDALRALFEAGADFVATAATEAPGTPAYATVIVPPDHLRLPQFIELVTQADFPIALALAAYGPSIKQRDDIEGLSAIFDAVPSVFMLRSDVSLFGLMLLGAIGGAIGLASTGRQVWMPPKYRPTQGPPRLLLPRPMLSASTDDLANAGRIDGLDQLFECSCAVCGEGGDVRALADDSVSPESRVRHDIGAWTAIKGDVLKSGGLSAWSERVDRGIDAWETFQAHAIDVREPTTLKAWRDYLS